MSVGLDSVVNTSALVSSFWSQGFPVLVDKAAPLIKVLQAAGIVFIIYLTFLIVKSILAMRDHRRLKRIEVKLDSLIGLLGPREKPSKKSTHEGVPLKNQRGKKSKNNIKFQ